MSMSRTFAVFAVAAGAVLAAAGCGSDESADAGSPQRIVSLSPSATEMLFAVGAGGQVVAVDDQSDFPAHAPRTSLSSYQPNVEAIARFRPDLVVAPDGMPRDAIDGLRRLRLRVLVQPAPRRLAGAFRQIRELAALTGHPRAGARVARRVRSRVERAFARAPGGSALKVFHELDQDLYSAASTTFIGRIYARLGLRNVADAAARSAGTPYPQLSSEAVVAANPDLIVLADRECYGQTPARAGRRPGWEGISAVRRGAVVAIDDDIASRWGPRISIFVERVADAMEAALKGADPTA
jgi:iron complex transport system substrate-binding protein